MPIQQQLSFVTVNVLVICAPPFSVTFVDIISYLLDRNILLNSYFVNRNYVFIAIHKFTAVQKKDAPLNPGVHLIVFCMLF